MNPRLHSDITRQLDRDFAFKRSGEWLRGGECPSCKKKELYTSAEKPWVLRCGRLNKCGAEYHVKELYEDLFSKWSERHPVTPENPNAAADAYMRDGRGFDLAKVKGWYEQESYFDPVLKIGSATVRFPLPGIGYWERIIDQPQRFGKRKATFKGDYKGTWWVAPGVDLAAASVKEIWITEGIFDSTALLHHDIASASALSCNNYPDKALKELAAQCAATERKRPKLVWALDTGKAGADFTRKHVERSIKDGWEAVAAQPPEDGKTKLDWNELHQRDRLNRKTLDEALYNGALLMAKNAHEKALLIFNHDGYNSFHMEHDKRMWWFELNLEKFAKAKEDIRKSSEGDLSDDELRDKAMLQAHTLREIANCFPTPLYFQQNLLTDESWYYLRIEFPHDGPAVKSAFSNTQMRNAKSFGERLYGVAAGAVYTGTAGQHDLWLKKETFNIKTVQTIDFIGYSKDYKTWVFNDVAVNDGKLVQLNVEDFFDMGRLSIKSLSKSVQLHINDDLKDFTTEWLPLLWRCYHHKGIVALAFWLGSLFAEQIRERHDSYPFLEIVGEQGAGKSNLIKILWRLLGRKDYEGFDPSKSSIAARSRNFSQVSNMPVVLMEGDRVEDDRLKQKSFDWDETKPLYEGRSVYSRGVKNGGNETYEPPFRGALVIVQNHAVKAQEATMARMCHVSFDKSEHTTDSKLVADELKQIEINQLSGFVLKACMAEKAIMATFNERMPVYEKAFYKLKGLRDMRIAKNHAMLAALVDALTHVIQLGSAEREQTHAFIEDMAVERQETINTDHVVVQNFWETYDFLNGDEETPRLNHARKGDQQIAINLNHFIAVAADSRQQLPELSELKKLLKTSRARKFIDIKPVNSAIYSVYNKRKAPDAPARPETVKCWVFENPSTKGGRDHGT